jgi:aspartokinase
METIAVYWEAQVRVYGLTERRGLSMLTLRFPSRRLEYWAGTLSDLRRFGEFELVLMQPDGAACKLTLLPRDSAVAELEALLRQRLQGEQGSALSCQQPVAVLYLYGPHFQDRYGIAEAALRPLRQAGIGVLAMGCAGTSVYLVVDEGMAERARAALAETFVL